MQLLCETDLGDRLCLPVWFDDNCYNNVQDIKLLTNRLGENLEKS